MEQFCPHPHFVKQALLYLKDEDVLYLHNAKSGCSTVKAGLIQARSPSMGIDLPEKLGAQVIHGNWAGWNADLGLVSPETTFAFTVVRNPYTRLLSAYLDKIARPGILREQFLYSVGLPAGTGLSFKEFIDCLEANDILFDQHWRPQVANVFAGQLRINQVHYLEGFSESKGELENSLGFDVDFATRDSHGTSAKSKLDKYYTDETRDAVLRIYGDDFGVFGYSREIEEADSCPARPTSLEQEGTGIYRLLSFLPGKLRPTIAELSEIEDFEFAEKAIAYLVFSSKELDRLNIRFEDFAEPALGGNPSEKYLSLSVLEKAHGEAGDELPLEDTLRKLSLLAPYFLSNWFKLVDHLIDVDKRREARLELGRLEMCTWRKNRLQELRDRL